MKKLKEMPEPEHEEHPEDRRLREESEREADKWIDKFCEQMAPELKALIRTYGDGDAEELLSRLREQFWTSLPFAPEAPR